MKSLNKSPLLLVKVTILVLIIVTTGCSRLWTLSQPNLSSTSSDTRMQPNSGETSCQNMNLEEKRERDINGYSTSISLEKAVEIFNKEKQCDGLLAQYPALTEEEVITAIVFGPDPDKQGEIWLRQKEELWNIASQKLMPKGSLLVAQTGSLIKESPLRPYGTIRAKGITITLILGLDKIDRLENTLKPEQALVIRKVFSEIETVR